MNAGPGLVLIVDDEALMLRALGRILRADGHDVLTAADLEAAEAALLEHDVDVVLLDLHLGAADGLDVLGRIKHERPEAEVVMMTGHATVESAVGCMRSGAFDYLVKPFDDAHTVRRAVQRALDRRRVARLDRGPLAPPRSGRLPELVGEALPIRRLVRTIEGLRDNESHVLIQGESGSGKELVARAIHATSRRSGGPFVPVDCGALPETVIESELFGHRRGAFTGAVGAPGLFRMAHGGTLFLDEIGEIPLPVQAKLLRALQHKEIRPVGSSESVPVDIRIVTATHRDLDAMVELKRFRTDLYYRLNVVRLEIPPLRARPGDIPLLVRHFLDKHRRADCPVLGIREDALAMLVAYPWPGNVRELENVIESALALAPGPELRPSDLPLGRRRPHASHAAAPPVALPLSLDAYECSALERALREAGGNATEAARRLGIGRSTFYRKLTKHGLRADTSGVGGGESIR